MRSASTKQVLAAARQWLRPLVHVLIRCGVTWKEFAELSRRSYVEVASHQFGKRGRPTNVSRTAVLTGLTRREVRKQRARLAATTDTFAGHVTKASLVLSAWHQDRDLLDSRGKPLPLPLEGEGVSFAALLRRCGAGDVRPSTLLKELLSAQAVREDRKSTRLNSSHGYISYAVFCLKKKKQQLNGPDPRSLLVPDFLFETPARGLLRGVYISVLVTLASPRPHSMPVGPPASPSPTSH